MGPFPFIRFEQAEINGNFGDEHAYRRNYLTVLNAFFVDDYFVGDKFFIAINEIKNEIQLLNDAPTFASLELVLPSPYPTSVGVEVYTLEITIEQQTDYLPSFIAITFDLTDGLVTSSTTVYTAGLTKLDSATNGPYIAEELKLAKTLSVYQQNGAAIFPDTFEFDSTTGIAEKRLVRAYDWKYNTAINQPQREGITDLQVIPKTVFRLRELSQNEKAMVSFFLEKPIKESLTNDNWNAGNIYLIPLLGDWQFDFITVSSVKKQLSISSSEYGISLILAGIKVSSKWYFQRFVDPVYISGTPPDLVTLLTTDSPASPNIGRLYYNASPLSSNYYDFDQCEFGTVINEEPFNLIIKSGDTYQINLLKDLIFNPDVEPESDEDLKIGIFDCNGQYLQDIGTFNNPFNKTLQWNIFWDIGTSDYLAISILRSYFDTTNADLILKSCNVQFIGIDTLITIPNASLVLNTTDADFADSISTYLSSNGFLTTWDTAVVSGTTIIQFYTNCPSIQTNGIVAKIEIFAFTGAISFATFEPPATQYQATITIPPLANGIYIIGIYNTYFVDETNYITLFATSQPLELNNFEDFTQMLEYGSAQDSIIEGFEYLNGWIQRIRVPLNGAGQTYSLEESIYRNSDGTFQKPQNSTDENISLHTDYLDLQTQRAMTSATRHPIFVLANQNLSVQGDLEIATNQDYTTNQSFRKLQQMRFQAKNQGYQPNNNSCLG